MDIKKIAVTLGHAVTFGLLFANAVKKYANNPLVEAAVAATSTKIDDAALLAIQEAADLAIKALNWTELKLGELSEDNKAIVLHVMNALAIKASSPGTNIETALTLPQVAYKADNVKGQ